MPEDFEGRTLPERQIQYTPELRDLILEFYTQGHSLLRISEMPEMPCYSTILRWVRDSERMRAEFEGARFARALDLEEKALAIAENRIDKDDAAGERLRFDIFRWGAEVGNPAQYGKKVTVGGDASRPIIFQVVTGVPAPEGRQGATKLDAQGLVVPHPVNAPLLSWESATDPAGDVPMPEILEPPPNSDATPGELRPEWADNATPLFDRLLKNPGMRPEFDGLLSDAPLQDVVYSGQPPDPDGAA